MSDPSKQISDYILGITKTIWEDREIGSLTRHYGENLVVRSPASIVEGNQGIIAATMATLAEFPDRQLFGEDVMWVGSAEKFLSSHRLLCTANHSSAGVYGSPTKRDVSYRIIADCYCADGAVQDEWLVRDQSAIVSQLGFDIEDWTRDLINREGGPDACVRPFTPSDNVAGPYTTSGCGTQWGQQISETLLELMSSNYSVISKSWDRAAECHYAGATSGIGWDFADRFWLGLRSCFPTAVFQVHHTTGMDQSMLPPRASVRWSLDGSHSSSGRYGIATHAPVHIMGITHVEFGPKGIKREWTLIDDTAIYKQILLHTGRV